MLLLIVAANVPDDCRLSSSVWVVGMELMVANHLMMILYMRGTYSTPSNIYLLQ
jgi:hypothetical protein